jgi:hypothetical protein
LDRPHYDYLGDRFCGVRIHPIDIGSGLLILRVSLGIAESFYLPTAGALLADYFGTGGQLTLEHRRSIYGEDANDVTVGAGAVPAYPEGDVFARADLRVLDDTGYLIAYDDPVGVARELAAFLV